MISYVDLFHRIYSRLFEKKSNVFQLLTYDILLLLLLLYDTFQFSNVTDSKYKIQLA